MKDLTGNRYGRWIVIEFYGRSSGKESWLCRCDCGTTKRVLAMSLLDGDSKSCGCLRRELSRARKPQLLQKNNHVPDPEVEAEYQRFVELMKELVDSRNKH